MPFDRAAAVAKHRRVVHDGMKVEATYEHASNPGVVTPLTVRWHNKLLVQGNLVEAGYVDAIEGVNSVVFDREELSQKNIVLQVGGRVRPTHPGYNGAVLTLETQQPDTGPINRVWGVTRA